MTDTTLAGLVRRIEARSSTGRVIVGIAGAPGAGKTTLAEQLVGRLECAVHVPMDGFHLANSTLDALGRRDRKGAPDTFDAFGYVALLRRIRAELATIVYAPAFDRRLEEPVAGSIAVGPEVRVVVTEGNYLLLDQPGWREVAASLDERWFLETPDAVRGERLVRRHESFGRDHADAVQWIERVDERNAVLVSATRQRAELIIRDAGR